MSGESKRFPSVEDLETAAWLCSVAAASTDRDHQFLFGLGMIIARTLHDERGKRFKEAAARMKTGAGVQELGLSFDDFTWVASKANRVVDAEGWKRRFEAAANEVKESE